MKKIIKFSKSYRNILDLKKSFFFENQTNLKSSIKINKVYKKNPARRICKNCQKKSLSKFIKSHLIDYYICKNCSHLNGKYQDTENFATNLYFKNSGKNYYKNYLNDYEDRVKNIYLPKVDFLKKIIKEKINLIDIGSGGGHFLKALELKKINAIGFEPSKILCKLGSKKLKYNILHNSNFDKVYQILKKQKKFNTVSLIGVLEHLTNPHRFLKTFKESSVKFMYISVPLLSLSVFLENSFEKIFPRQLSGAHTHLYTEKSLKIMLKNYNLKIIGEWWFGTDFADLYRCLINSSNFTNKKNYLTQFNKFFYDHLDELQNILDKNKISSEVHLIIKK